MGYAFDVSFTRRALLLFALLSFRAGAEADAKTVVPVLLRVLTHDVNFDSRGAGPFVVLIVGQPKATADAAALAKELDGTDVPPLKTRKVKFASADLRDEAALQAEIDKTKAAAVVVLPGINGAGLTAVWDVCQDNQLYVLAVDSKMVDTLPLALEIVGDKKQILINGKSAKAVGVRFDAAILEVARVIQ